MPKVLVVGSGGREHALAHTLHQSPSKPEIIGAPGNAGVAQVGRCVDVSAGDIEGLVAVAESEGVDLVMVGPEAPLVAGLADRLRDKGIAVVGPSAAAAQLEGSKAFAKSVMAEGSIPTARGQAFESIDEAKAFARTLEGKVAVKADGLAGGKGVIVTDDIASAEAAIDQLGGGRLVIEEKLEGEELSVIALTDGNGVALLAPSQDHKRVGDGDTGPNTGGMGAYAPAPRGTAELLEDVKTRCIQPVLDVMRARGTPFAGVLYAGLMLTDDGPKVLEYNVRFGDPETQVILPLLDEDLYTLLCDVAHGRLESRTLRQKPLAALTVVLASEGYPKKPRTGDRIEGLDRAQALDHVIPFLAGATADEAGLTTSGGRVLALTGLGSDLSEAHARAYAATDLVRWPGVHFRRDIGHRALNG